MTKITSRFNWALPCAVAGVGSLLMGVICYQLWHGHPGIPFAYYGDALPTAMHIKHVIANGNIYSDSRLGAPLGQHFADWPTPDVLTLWEAAVLGVFSNSWPFVMNTVFLGTFVSAGAVAWWVMRYLGVSRWTAVAFAIVYSILPYHFGRGEEHLFLSGYFVMPLTVWIAVKLLRGESLFPPRASGKLRRVSWATLRTLIFAVLIASSSVYYAAFAVVAVVAAALVAFLRSRGRLSSLLPSLVVCVALFATVVAVSIPTLLYHAEHGANSEGGQRRPLETEYYGLKLAQMLLPVEGHRLAAFARIHDFYYKTFSNPGEHVSVPLGIIGAVGLVWLFAIAITRIVARKESSKWMAPHQDLAYLATCTFLVGTIGGIATLIALFLNSEIRDWNRISVLIGFLALSSTALLFDLWVHNRQRRGGSRSVVAMALVVVVGLAAFDQSSPQRVFPYKAVQDLYLNDHNFFSAVEAKMPQGASIYQMPYLTFPEDPHNYLDRMGNYDQLRPFLQTHDLKWSFGGVKGRVAGDWPKRMRDDSPQQLLENYVATGFTGVMIDRWGYPDGAKGIESQFGQLLGITPLVSADQRESFWDIRRYANELKVAEPARLESLEASLLFPVDPEAGPADYNRPDQIVDGRSFEWAKASEDLEFDNEAKVPLDTTVTFGLTTGNGDDLANFDITWPDGQSQKLQVGGKQVPISHTMKLKPGRNKVHISTDAPLAAGEGDNRDLHFRVYDRQASKA